MARSKWNIVIAATLALTCMSSAQAKKLRFATFNIKFYGTGGSMQGSFEEEQRDQHLRTFLDTKLGDVDVIAFQEIVDVSRFKRRVVRNRYDCESYDHHHPRHLHVVICVRDGLRFRKVRGEDDFVVQDVALSANHRPAMWGVVTDLRGRSLVQFAAVHFKAQKQFSDVREVQAQILADAIAASPERVPTVITGDFNTYGSDEEIMDEIFEERDVNLERVPISAAYTYRTERYRSKFDRFWVTSGTTVTEAPEVWRVCNEGRRSRQQQWDGRDDDPFADLDYYNENVSDHCPVQVELQL